MVRYRYTGSPLAFTAQTTGGGTADISNSGVTVITSTAAERYVLAPPVLGCRKLLIVQPSGTTGRVIELSSVSSGDSITIQAATGGGTITELTLESTDTMTVELVGISDTRWKLLYQTSGVPAALSTGFVYAAS